MIDDDLNEKKRAQKKRVLHAIVEVYRGDKYESESIMFLLDFHQNSIYKRAAYKRTWESCILLRHSNSDV